MPMPWTYRHGAKEWARFLADIRDVMGTPSDNVAFTTAEGVFCTFRARLTVEEMAAFARILPAMLRALFFEKWTPGGRMAWANEPVYLEDVKALRRNHNLSNDLAIEAVSVALHRAVGKATLTEVLAAIGPEATAFWRLRRCAGEDLQQHGF